MQTTGQVLEKLPIIFVEVFGTIFLAGFAALLGVRESVGWIMFLVIFLPRVFIPWRDVGYSHNIQLYVLGMWVSKWPLAKSDQVKALVRMYWPLLVALILFLHMPEYSGRCDKIPVATWFHRFRWYAIENIILLVFFTGALNTSGDAYGLTKWLGPWALFAYCFHVAADRLLPRPWATVVMFASSGLFYLIARRTQHSKDSRKKSEEADVKLDGPLRNEFDSIGHAADRGRSESAQALQSKQEAPALPLKGFLADEESRSTVERAETTDGPLPEGCARVEVEEADAPKAVCPTLSSPFR